MSPRTISRLLTAAFIAAAALFLRAAPAAAQADVRMIRPNVLIMLDTSGSMEWRNGVANTTCIGADGGPCNTCSNGASICSAACPVAEQRNRWSTAVEVLTGTIENFACREIPRINPADFDYLYPIAHHEILSNNVPLWQASLGARQSPDGILDVYQERVRFGLMTFDTDYDPGLAAVPGMYSYGPDRNYRANGCAVNANINIGARRASLGMADPVPGGLVSVGPPNADATMLQAINTRIQTSIIGREAPGAQSAIRPYGGTPIAAMLDDALSYWTSNSDVTSNAAGTGDPYYACRDRFNILITDGLPNMDFRPACVGGTGACPYNTPDQTAMTMRMSGGGLPNVRTYVVAFNASDPSARAALDPIAIAGGTGAVLYATNRAGLQSALSSVLDTIASATSTRTSPAFGVQGGTGMTANGALYQFQSSFAVASGYPWEGVLERRRSECVGTPPVPVDQSLDVTRDDFGLLLRRSERSARGWGTRRMWTHIPTGATMLTQMRAPITRSVGLAPRIRQLLDTSVPPWAFASTTAAQRDTLFAWLRGDAGTVRELRPLGDIFHSNPLVVPAPPPGLRDQTFADYRQRTLNPSTWRRATTTIGQREQALFVGTNDGVLHAFNTDTGEEIWGFVPPYLTGSILSMYPNTHQYGVDGNVVVRDVVYQRSGTALGDANSWRSVLITGLRAGGGAYVALDVTDPYEPHFLWQFTAPNLVNSYATPAIGMAYVRPPGGGMPAERAIAVIAGGTGIPAPACGPMTGVRPVIAGLDTRLSRDTSAGQPRANIRCWQPGTGQSLYVLDVETGTVLRSFGSTGSPLVGSPALFLGTDGAVATRAYVGDADGAVWRLDLTNPDPAQWRFGIAFDTFFDAGWDRGQMLVAQPVISQDRDGSLLIGVGSGDPDLLEGLELNRMAVYRERQDVAAAGGVSAIRYSRVWELRGVGGGNPAETWYPGERLTGAISLFNGSLYFGTFVPANSTDACQLGFSRLWGVDLSQVSGMGVTPLPTARLDVDGNPATTMDIVRVTQDLNGNGSTVDDANSVLYGVGIVRRPSCVNVTSQTDPYTGGTRPWVQDVAGGDFRLVVQTGRGGVAGGGSRTNVVSRPIPSPILQSSLSAWAVVFE